LTWIEKRIYHKIQRKIALLEDEYLNLQRKGEKIHPDFKSQRSSLIGNRVRRFPDEEQWILPTAFGNTIRAFEVYPRVMYGVEAISWWSRLLAIMPDEFRVLIDDAKAQVDFWLNLGIIALGLMIEYIGLATITGNIEVPWIIIIIVALALFAQYRARRSTVEWGNLVMAAFDIYRFPLLDAMGLERPTSRKSERILWTKLSQAITYEDPSVLPKLKKPTPKKK
jgi:hypothetical protein